MASIETGDLLGLGGGGGGNSGGGVSGGREGGGGGYCAEHGHCFQ